MEAFKNYMSKFVTQEIETTTHLGMGKLSNKYNIPDDKLDEFYNKFIETSSKAIIPLIERNIPNQGIVKVDLDFHYENMTRKFDEVFITKIVKAYLDILKEDLIFENDDKKLLECWVFARQEPYKTDKVIKDGLHLMFPLFKTDNTYLHMLREEIINRCSNLLRPMSDESVDKIVDKSVIEKNGWLLYGASKPDTTPYKLIAVFDNNMTNIICDVNQDMKYLIHHLSIRRDRKYLKAIPPKKVMMEEVASSNISVSMKQSGNKNVYENATIVIPKKKIEISEQLDNNIVKSENNELSLIIQLIDLLDPDRLHNDINYLRISKYLYSISSELEESWINYNKKLGIHYNEMKCKETWMNYTYQKKKKKNLENIGTLHYWAKTDNIEKYNKIMKERIHKRLYDTSEKFTHYNLAQILYELYRYEFVCASIQHKKWYHFRNHRWYEMHNGQILKRFLSEDVTRLFNEIVIENQQKIGDPSVTSEQRAIILQRIKSLNKDINNLGMANFKENVIKEAADLFYDREFEEKLDVNPLTIGFTNGIYDLESQEFRPGTPDDMVSLTTHIDYEDYSPEDENITEIMSIIQKILPNQNVREYMLTFLASCLSGTPLQLFHIFTGSGSNGKSVLVDLFEKSIGDYGIKLPVSFITQKRSNSSQASPELVKTKGARWVSLQEPDEGSEFNSGLLKEITGSDKISARALFQNQIQFKPMFNPAMCCNHLPKMKSMDGGTWRRIRVVEFISKFVDNLNNKEETYGHSHVFLKDRKLYQKLENYSSAFMFILLKDYYPKFLINGLDVIDEVNIITKRYKAENDIFDQFFQENIRKNDTFVLKIKDVYDRYKSWYSDKLGEKAPPQSEFKKSMANKAGEYSRIIDGWSGYELRIEYDVSNNDVKYDIAQINECEAL
jgi:P4 family phage/plasmid primase-like protien